LHEPNIGFIQLIMPAESRQHTNWVVLLLALLLSLLIFGCQQAGPEEVDNDAVLTVASVYPEEDETGVSVDTDVMIIFSRSIDETTLTSQVYTLSDASDDVAGTVCYLNGAAVFDPSSDLAYNTEYTASLSGGVLARSGAPLDAAKSWSFTTSASPSVATTYPASNANKIPINANIIASFSKPIDETTLSSTTFNLKDPGEALVGADVTVDTDGNAVLDPTTDLDIYTQYTATVTTGLKYASGTALSAQYSWIFTTSTAPWVGIVQFGSVGTNDGIFGIAVDATDNVYVTGYGGGDIYGETHSGTGNDILLVKHDPSGDEEWTKLLGVASDFEGKAIVLDSSGDAIFTGYATDDFEGTSNFAGNKDIFLAKWFKNGVKDFVKLLGIATNEEGLDVVVDASNDIYITGYTEGNLPLGSGYSDLKDVFIAKYDATGDHKWTKLLGSTGNEEGMGIAIDSAGNLYVTGYTESNPFDGKANNGGKDIFLAKYSSGGTLIWTELLGTTADDEGSDVVIGPDNDIFITGYSTGPQDLNDGAESRKGALNQGGKDIFIARYKSDGTLLLTQLDGGSGHEAGQSITVDSSGDIHITGYTSSDMSDFDETAGGDKDIFYSHYYYSSLIYPKYGYYITTRQLGTAAVDEGFDITINSDNDIMVTGITDNAGFSDVLIIKADASGDRY